MGRLTSCICIFLKKKTRNLKASQPTNLEAILPCCNNTIIDMQNKEMRHGLIDEQVNFSLPEGRSLPRGGRGSEIFDITRGVLGLFFLEK